MAEPRPKPLPPLRPEVENTSLESGQIGEVQVPLSAWERVVNQDWVRRVAILVILALAWEIYGRYLKNPLMVPTFSNMVAPSGTPPCTGRCSSASTPRSGSCSSATPAALGLAAVFTALAVSTRIGTDLLSTLTAMFNPLPAIALLPLALLWFGLGVPSLVFVIVHSVLWAVALNTHSGFLSVSRDDAHGRPELRPARRRAIVVHVLMPAAFPSILAGLKIGWAFAWRTLIAAELVFGVSSRSGRAGLVHLREPQPARDGPRVRGLLTAVIIIGLLVESVIFRNIEIRTVRKWGMQH